YSAAKVCRAPAVCHVRAYIHTRSPPAMSAAACVSFCPSPASSRHGGPIVDLAGLPPATEAEERGAQRDLLEFGVNGTIGANSDSDEDAAAAEIDDEEEHSVRRPRAVVQKFMCERKAVGDGFALRRSIGRPELQSLDPFISLDEFEFSRPAGFSDHPHRGFENVTYMLEGGLSYHDFSGHKGTINTGDVQVRSLQAQQLSQVACEYITDVHVLSLKAKNQTYIWVFNGCR
uniref:Pirin N-terminal domain-containing protein n=1 Tax=Aegilops tauschii subsp. strangulata TaxID=200361 RepID=A0A452ZVV9_AEGTS